MDQRQAGTEEASAAPDADRAANLVSESGLVYRWAFRLLQNHDDALDVTQSVVLRRLRAGASGPDQPLAWMRRVTINLSIDMLRRRRPSVPFEEAQLPAAAASENGDVERIERSGCVLQALRALSDQQRQVIVAKVFDGQTFQAIAEDLGLSASSVKTHYVRALQKLRAQLG